MFLTPEDRAVGKVNFCAAIGSRHVRRDFLLQGIKDGVASGDGLGSMYFDYENKLSQPIRVGVIGTGDEGSVLIGALKPPHHLEGTEPHFIQIASIADVRPYSIYRAFHGEAGVESRPGLLSVYGWKTEDEAKDKDRGNVQVYGKYQELLEHAEEDDLDGVIIALPLHLHAPAAIEAMDKYGLHVLTEKLMAHSVHECKDMARVAARAWHWKDKEKKGPPGVLLATGHQRHYSILYDNAVHAIKQGLLGQIHYVRAQWHRGNLPGSDSWQQPMPEKVKPKDPLAKRLAKELDGLKKKLKEAEEARNIRDIEAWAKRIAQKRAQIDDEILAGTAKDLDYKDKQYQDAAGKLLYDRPAAEELLRWRLWDRTGGGLMAELGSHQLDAASIFVAAMHEGKKQYPLSVLAAANRPLFPQDRDTEDHVYCLFEFPGPGYDAQDRQAEQQKIIVQYSSINGNGFGGYGEEVFGTEGTLLLETEKDVLLFKGSETSKKTKVVMEKRPGQKQPSPALAICAADDKEAAAVEEAAALGQLGISPAKRGYTEELEHWAWCIANRDPENLPRCHPAVAMADAVIALTTNIAARSGKRIEFNKEWFNIDSNETPEGIEPSVPAEKKSG